jgi:hypothetical protein
LVVLPVAAKYAADGAADADVNPSYAAITLLDSDDAKEVPDLLLAFTVNLYVPNDIPVTVIGLLVDEP